MSPDTFDVFSGTPATESKQETDKAHSEICYRMEPTKQMLDSSECRSRCTHSGTVHQYGPPCLLCNQSHTVIDLEKVHRVAMMVTPEAEGEVVDQVWEALAGIRAILKQQPCPMTVTSQTVFLKKPEYAETCRQLFGAYFGEKMPATNFVVQPPSEGQALAIEAWAVGGDGVEINFLEPGVVTISYDGLRWIYVVGVTPSADTESAV